MTAGIAAPLLLVFAQQSAAIRLDWRPCQTERFVEEVQCATLSVPENREVANGKRISLRVVNVPAQTTHASQYLIVFAGGPGSSAVAGTGSYAEQFKAIRKTHNILVMDQRGSGESNGLYCGFTGVREAAQALLSFNWSRAAVDRCLRFINALGDPTQYTTSIAVKDYEDLRRAVGANKVDVYGGSYGTRTALEYLRRYPSSVRTITLRAIVPPQTTLIEEAPRGLQRALARSYAACTASMKCNWVRHDLGDMLTKKMKKFDAHPIIIGLYGARGDLDSNIPFDGDMMVGALRRMLMDETQWSQVPNAIHRAGTDEAMPLGNALRSGLALETTQAQGLFWSVTCSEDAPRWTAQKLRNAAKGSPMRDQFVLRALKICEKWPKGSVPADFYQPVVSNVPALLMSGADDPVTPPAMGAVVARSLSASRHLVFEATSHGPFNDCQQAIASQFILAGAAQALDTTCMRSLKHDGFTYRRWWWWPFS